MTRMSTDGLHAEEVLIQDLKTLLGDKFDFKLIDGLYTERIPCGEPGHNCYSMIYDNLSYANYRIYV
jgi:hypothetical protein